MSDGRQQAVAPRDAAPQTVAGKLRHQGDPVFPVAFGQSRGLGAAQDVAVKDLLVSERVFVKNELAIAGQIRVDGYVNREIPVRVLSRPRPARWKSSAKRRSRRPPTGSFCR